jgi:hypothetical protein
LQRPRRTDPVAVEDQELLQDTTTGISVVFRQGFLPASMEFDMSAFATAASGVSDCHYTNPCGDYLIGKVMFAPQLGSYNENEILNRDCMPEAAVQVVCELDEGQEIYLSGECEAN